MPCYPFGMKPEGEFIFTADGHFSAGVESDRNGALPPDLPQADFDDLMGPFLGYFGTYAYDRSSAELTLNVAGASAPGYVMSDMSRTVSFDDKRLILSGTSIRCNVRPWSWQRVLERADRQPPGSA